MRRITLLIAALLAAFLISPAQADRRDRNHYYYYSPKGPPRDPEFSDAAFNLLAWYRGTNGTFSATNCTTAVGDANAIKCWADQSSNGNNVSEDSVNNGRVAGGSKGLVQSYIHNKYSGTTGRLLLSSGDDTKLDFAKNDAFTIFVRYSVASDQFNFIATKLGTSGLSTDAGWALDSRGAGGGVSKLQFVLYGPSATTRATTSYGAYEADTVQEVWVTVDGSAVAEGTSFRVNRAEVSETQANTGTLAETSNTGVFEIFSAQGTDANDMAIEELAIFDRVITTVEKQAFESGYLTDRYGTP